MLTDNTSNEQEQSMWSGNFGKWKDSEGSKFGMWSQTEEFCFRCVKFQAPMRHQVDTSSRKPLTLASVS